MAIIYPDNIGDIYVNGQLFTGPVLTVGSDHRSYDFVDVISACAAASSGSMILIYPGYYSGYISIQNKDLIIRGMGEVVQSVELYNDSGNLFGIGGTYNRIIIENIYAHYNYNYRNTFYLTSSFSGAKTYFNKALLVAGGYWATVISVESHYKGDVFITHCDLNSAGNYHYAGIGSASSTNVFSVLGARYYQSYGCRSCVRPPNPHDYKTTAAGGYGYTYGDYLVKFSALDEQRNSVYQNVWSTDDYIYQSVVSGVNIYNTSGNFIKCIEMPIDYNDTEQLKPKLIYSEDFSDPIEAQNSWIGISSSPYVYDFDQGYMRNDVHSSTWSTAVLNKSFEANHDYFDVKVRIVQAGSGSSHTDTFMDFFRDETTPTTPFVRLRLSAYYSGTTYNIFRFQIYADNSTLLYEHTFHKYNYYTDRGKWFWGQVKRDGDRFYIKHWRDDDAEPTDWDAITDIPNVGLFSGPIYVWSRTDVYTGYDDVSIKLLRPTNLGTTSVWANTDHLYIGTTSSGVYRTAVSGVLNTVVDLNQYAHEPYLTSDEVIYVHGNNKYLGITTVSGVDQYNLTTNSGIRSYKENLYKCYQTSSGTLYYVENNRFFGIDETPSGLNGNISDWKYYQKIIFTTTTKDNSQVKVIFKNDFPYEHAAGTGQDLRFIDPYGNVLDYYIESWYPYGEVIVNVPEIGTNNFYMLYGNNLAVGQSDPQKAYYFYDGFEGNSIDTNVWQVNTRGDGIVSVQNSYVRIYDADNDGTEIITREKIPYGMKIEARIRANGATNTSQFDGVMGYTAVTTGSDLKGYVKLDFINGPDDTLHHLYTTDANILGAQAMSFDWHNWIGVWSNGYQRSVFNDEVLELTSSGTLYESNNHLIFHINNGSSNPDMNIDWVKVSTWPTIETTTTDEKLFWDFIHPKLHVVYNPTTDWVNSDYQYEEFFSNPWLLNDLHITEATSTHGANTIFLATSNGAYMIDEWPGNEQNATQKRYFIA